MSEHAARSAISRMNMREVAVASFYTGLMTDLQQMASIDPKAGHAAFLERRADMCAAYGFDQREQMKPFAFANGIAIIPVTGSLINRFGGSWGSVTGYNFIRSQTQAAAADDDVIGIIYDVNTYGGEAAGMMELAREIFAVSKPTMAVVDSNAYSAGMGIASAAKKIYVTPSGGVGSVGVVAMHVDMSKALENWGYNITLIHSGDHKVDGNPYEPLPKDVLERMQAGCDATRVQFAQLVADHRGLDLKTVMDTEAACYRADEALALGLIDAIATPSEAVRAFFDGLTGSTFTTTGKGKSMSTSQAQPGANTTASTEQTATEARTAERARISGIQSCEEAKGRESLASHLALNTELSVDAAKSILAAAPKADAPKAAAPAAAAPAANPLAAAMAATGGGAGIGAEEKAEGGGEQPSAAAQILRDYTLASGKKFDKA